MIDAPSSTWFTAAPHWRWWIIMYFFFGGLAAGCYFLAVLIDLFGQPADRPLARLGYYIAFPLVVLCGLLLVVDLGQPLRFWHMLIQRNTFGPMFKLWSPMSTGSWALLIFGLFSFGGFLTALADDDRLTSPTLRRLQPRLRPLTALKPPSMAGRLFAAIGGIFGFFIAGYTGVLLSVTNRPIWSDTNLLGLLFVVSAASTSAALLMLLGNKRRWTMPALAALHRMDVWMIVLELVVLIAVVISLGPVLTAWLNAWGALLIVGVVIIGLLVPLAMSWRPGTLRWSSITLSAVLVLIGGFILRVVVVLSSESVQR
jgi:formate-dependent nitrite reductase membrane component NrfD